MTSPARLTPPVGPTPPARPTPSAPASDPVSLALDIATALVRAWTRAYTWRMEPAVRDRRRAEIESELWEFDNDADRGKYPAAHMLARLLIGIPDDLSWRAEHKAARRTRVRTSIRVAAWTAATVIIAAALWILPLMMTATLPPLPDKPRIAIKAPPPPAPPPPPPCAPANYPQFRPCAP